MNSELKCFNYLYYFNLSEKTDNYEDENLYLCESLSCPNRYMYYSEEQGYNNWEFIRPNPTQENLPEPVPQNTGRFSALASWQETCAATPQTSWTLVAPTVIKLSERLLEYTALINLMQLPTEVLDFAHYYNILGVTYEAEETALFFFNLTMAGPLQPVDILTMVHGLAIQIGGLSNLSTDFTTQVNNLMQQVNWLTTVQTKKLTAIWRINLIEKPGAFKGAKSEYARVFHNTFLI